MCCSLIIADNPQVGGDSRVIAVRDVDVFVFRHHPGIMDTKENMRAKRDDERTILKALEKNHIGHRYSGGLGRGYSLSIQSCDYERWRTMIEALSANSELRFYKPDCVDRHGYGLLPVKEEDLFFK
jgi:hypothetical protein